MNNENQLSNNEMNFFIYRETTFQSWKFSNANMIGCYKRIISTSDIKWENEVIIISLSFLHLFKI